MGVPAFYRWLSEKYPKIVLDVLEERVQLAPGSVSVTIPMDCTKPNPNGIECNNLYIDMNGIIHPCSHPENGPQPTSEEEMYENICHYVDRLFRVYRPRSLLYLAIDGVAPRAKMNQQRSRRFRSAQEARDLAELTKRIKREVISADDSDDDDNNDKAKEKGPAEAWDSNVITPGTPFMIKLAEYIRFYIRKRISTDVAWKNIKVIFSDASIPGEGEHKIMNHIRLQRTVAGYNPNTVHILHGLDADLIMLALATHEIHFYISREEVLFGRKSEEVKDKRQLENGYKEQQTAFDDAVGSHAMQLIENCNKPLQMLSIPVLREYLSIEFARLLQPKIISFAPTGASLERIIDDFVFMCFFVGNDFLPHLPSLDIRDGALDFLLNVYQRLLPGMNDYLTKTGGYVNLHNVDILLGEVGQIEDYVFQLKYDAEQQQLEQQRRRREEQNRHNKKKGDAPPTVLAVAANHTVRGKAAKILEQQHEKTKAAAAEEAIAVVSTKKNNNKKAKLTAGSSSTTTGTINVSHIKAANDNVKAAKELKESLLLSPKSKNGKGKEENSGNGDDDNVDSSSPPPSSEKKRKRNTTTVTKDGVVGEVGDAEEEFDADDDNDDDEETDTEEEEDDDEDDASSVEKPKIEKVVAKKVVDPAAAQIIKERVKLTQQQQLDEYAKNVVDNVRLHEEGWKDRYYTDKCKADDVANHGGREHMFRSYVMGLCWVMKYYYDGVPSWKWYYPFHYGPFASDLRNIERFENDCKSFQINKPFNPVEQLMAVLPADSAHAIPKASRWLMSDPESPIIDFYPTEVPVDPNGKAMPWLWVVLLPFIDEDRLLSAMSETMKKWTPTEQLCNARGLDDGYLYVHRTRHPLSNKLSTIIIHAKDNNKGAATTKQRLTDAVQYGISGSVRPPLSNEIYPPDQDVVVPLPASAISKADLLGDGIFGDPIDPNDAICVAFTEPPKLSHKSILLAGVKIPRAVLTSPEDRMIRRPKLNRFGGTIAHLGGGQYRDGQSHQNGYGSMNISQYERDLARQNGRGNELYQAGTRTWGSLEPTPKRFQPGVRPNQFQPHNGGGGGGIPPPPPPPHGGGRQGFSFAGNNNNNNNNNNGNKPSRWGTAAAHPPRYPQQQQQPPPPYQRNQPGYGHAPYQPGPPQYNGGNQYQQQYHNNNNNYNQQHHGAPPPPPPPPPPRHGHGQHGGRGSHQNHHQQHHQGPPHQQQQIRPQPARANADVMNSLRAQLTSTLKQNNNRKPHHNK